MILKLPSTAYACTLCLSAALFMLGTSSWLSAQQPQVPAPASNITQTAVFDVAAIHKMKDTDPRHTDIDISSDDNGNLKASGVTMRLLLTMAWNIDESRIHGGPDWIASDRFVLEAKPDEALGAQLAKLDRNGRKQARQHMLQALLIERLNLKSHWTTEQMPVLALEVGKNGPKLHPSPEPKPAEDGQPAKDGSSMNTRNTTLTAERVTMDRLATFLAQNMHMLVQNQTGLKGVYDFTLEWTPDEELTANNASYTKNAADEKPSMPTAVEEQLGLKLSARKGPVDVLVIDSIDKPSEN
ncbi:TIGR03435 family protein [Telmatobacter bradus]|uniref:TIGR03435 family protein n=1 Tax=Telmatobacter bradus TaxID=474953 RepID=UPI003B434D40